MYSYSEEKPKIFTEEGQKMFLAIRDHVHDLLEQAGAVRMGEAFATCGGGDSWTMLACVDRLVELGEIAEITDSSTAGQDRVFVIN